MIRTPGETAMKMPQAVYDELYSDVKAVIAKIEEVRRGGERIDPSKLTMRAMWDAYHIANTDRGHADHPRHHAEGMLPRCVEFTDRSPYWLGNEHDLNDSHIETAFRQMIRDLGEEYAAEAVPAPGR